MVKKQEQDSPTAVYDHEGLRLIYEKTNSQVEDSDSASETSDTYSFEDANGMSTT